MSLVRIYWEQEVLTFARIERKTPVLILALQSKQICLCGLHRSKNQGGGVPNGQIVIIKWASDGRRQRSREIIGEEREKYRAKNGSLRNTSTDSKERLLWFTQARPLEKKDWLQRAKQERRTLEMSLWKRAGYQTESKAFEKSLVALIVRDPDLGLLNSSKRDWTRNTIWSTADRPEKKPAWRGERVEVHEIEWCVQIALRRRR